MNSSFNSANVTTSVSSEPKELVFHIKGLTVMAVARMSYCVDAVSKDLQVVVIDGGDGRNGMVVGHKKILYHR